MRKKSDEDSFDSIGPLANIPEHQSKRISTIEGSKKHNPSRKIICFGAIDDWLLLVSGDDQSGSCKHHSNQIAGIDAKQSANLRIVCEFVESRQID